MPQKLGKPGLARLCWLFLGLLLASSRAPSAPAEAAATQRAQELLVKAQVHVASLPASRVKDMLTKALTQLGIPYRWGGDDPDIDGGYDCVGFAYHLFHAAGMEFPLARFSSLNMTSMPRGSVIPKVWWTEPAPDFAATMKSCDGLPPADGDVLIYHVLANGKIIDRTGHAVVVVDAKAALGISAATGGVRLHALGDLRRYANKQETACWRAASAAASPHPRLQLTWTLTIPSDHGGQGTHLNPFLTKNPLDIDVAIHGVIPDDAKIEVSGRVLSFIGAVSPHVDTTSVGKDERRLHLHHDFHAVDLPVDPGEHIQTSVRKIVVRVVGTDGMVLAEHGFYVGFVPYWG